MRGNVTQDVGCFLWLIILAIGLLAFLYSVNIF